MWTLLLLAPASFRIGLSNNLNIGNRINTSSVIFLLQLTHYFIFHTDAHRLNRLRLSSAHTQYHSSVQIKHFQSEILVASLSLSLSSWDVTMTPTEPLDMLLYVSY